MSRFSAHRPTYRLLLVLPLLALCSCGNDNLGAVITVPNSVVVSDLNGDGTLDVAVVAAQIDQTGLTQPPGLLGTMLNIKATPGLFSPTVQYETSSSPPSGLAVGDIVGNGSHDLVSANFNAGTLSLFTETSPTSAVYNKATSITVGGHPNDVQIADINGDGLPDLIVADDTGKVTYLLQSSTSPGTFLPPVSLPITNRGIAVAVGDLNGDGLVDLAVTSFDVNGDFGLVTIYFQDPSHPGTFLPTPATIVALGEPVQIRIADVNGDGAKDLVIACQGLGAAGNPTADPSSSAYAESLFGAMVILQNSATPGSFATPVMYAAVEGTLSLAVADLNGDGLPDIAMVSLYPQGQGYVATLMQDPSAPGTFLGAATYAGFGQPVSIVIGDMDNDGLPDLVTADGTGAVWYKNLTATPGSFAIQAQIGQLGNQ
ncbi:MAG TPA: VCBS repeat-containing protein [Steroidobacteraceae bacterium]|nr:VCBS repeat-containing protein [Steroidobacteraceae bacterium]